MIGARLKPAARRAVEYCGGVDGAGATTSRGRSTCGRWMALNEPDLPGVECAVLLDQVAVASGHLPQITEAMARELGFALLRLPDAAHDGVAHGAADWMASIGALSAEAGEAVQRLCAALALNPQHAQPTRQRIDRAALNAAQREIDDVIRAAVTIQALIKQAQKGEN